MFGEIIRADVRSEEQGAVVVSGTRSTVVLGPYNVAGRFGVSFCLYNQDASLTLSGAMIQVNPDRHGHESVDLLLANPAEAISGPNAALWVDYINATVAPNINATRNFQNIGPGQVRAIDLGGVFPWWRIVATNDQTPSITVSGWLYASSLG